MAIPQEENVEEQDILKLDFFLTAAGCLRVIKEEIIRLGEQLITILHVLLRALLRFAARLALKFRAN
eukprot:12783040-Ditylum_brightwellii.AAC.1